IQLSVKRKDGKIETLKATLGNQPGSLPGVAGTIPDKLPEVASFKKALAPLERLKADDKKEDDKKAEEKKGEEKVEIETGLLERNTPDGEHKYWLWVYPDYDPNVAHSVIVWMHPPGKGTKDDLDSWADLWDIDYCRKNHIILVMPVEKEEGWHPRYAEPI